jgi:hypothetical protein
MTQQFKTYTNSITNLVDANNYIQQKYGTNAMLKEIVVDGKTKYQFCNIPSVKNYPHKLKNVTSAMNVLFAHERGWIAYNKNLKNSI